MNFRKRNIALIFISALVLAFIGGYAGIKLGQANNPVANIGSIVSKDDDKTPEDMSKLVQTYSLIKQHYIEDVEDDQLMEGAIQGMLETLDDPYSTYMDLETMEKFQEQIEASFEGIGAEVSMVNGKVTIVAPIKDSPAEEVGLRPNDQIISIDDDDIKGLDLQEAVEKIRGEKGSEVVIEIERPGVSEPFTVTIVRDEIPIETVYARTETVDGKKTGIIELTSFAETTADDFASELAQLEEDGIEGLVIDVRGNPGGLLDSVGDILGHFIPKDTPFMQREDSVGERESYYTNLSEKKDYPISVLIDEGSASASEILAIAMKEIGYDVIGQTSYGKGTVQQAVPLGDGSTIKLTFYKWLSPKGNWIHEKGVEPTKEQKQPDYFYSNPIQADEPLTRHDSGEKIENMQQMLIGLGYKVSETDGNFDEVTEAAVRAFQKDIGVKETGEVDEETANLIEAKVIDKIRSREDDKQLERALKELY